ncbi:MAG TPA: YafY family protein [Aliidongia sp.]|uniref:helix-turn-helix transcriptional regulator n=1 Tax=Aliidongia sp. TaxID=1914230 RepID=UPI002DDD594F|nr:YafY family protein [Aliidongia sp.]HEV2676806.1 YafY family protein [Aliidongia sp.]
MTRIERAFAILLLLSDGSMVTATDLARRFEVSVRTIYRDVEMLSETGVPVYAERGAQGGYRLLEGYFLPPVTFSRAETVAMLLSLALARGLKVPPFAAELESAERKLVAALPARLKPLLAETRRLVGFERTAIDTFHPEWPGADDGSPAADAAEARAVETFLKAVLDGTRVRFTYRTPYNRPGSMVEAQPQGLLWDRDRWYLIGLKLDGRDRPPEQTQRFWRADRVLEIELSTLRSPISPFDVRPLLDRVWLGRAMARWNGPDPVRIRMTKAQVQRLRRDWYYRFADYAPGGPDHMIVSYGEGDPAPALELVRWLGPEAELLAPAAWREKLRLELLEMAATLA